MKTKKKHIKRQIFRHIDQNSPMKRTQACWNIFEACFHKFVILIIFSHSIQQPDVYVSLLGSSKISLKSGNIQEYWIRQQYPRILNARICKNIECKNALIFGSVKLSQPARNIFTRIKWDSLKFQNYFSNQSIFWIARTHVYPLNSGKGTDF